MRRWTPAFEESLRSHHYPGQMALPGEFDENSYLSDRPSTTVPVPDKTLLEEVSLHRVAMIEARLKWIAAIYAAQDAGFTNTQIGGMSGMTEAGIRQLLKRNRRPHRKRVLAGQ